MVDVLTGSAFDAPRRMHHREDEVALEFPSSASSRRRNLLALKACNWRAGGSPTPPPPYDSLVEFITLNGSQYFDTGVDILGESALLCDMRVEVAQSGDRCIAGCRTGSETFKGPNFYSGTIETTCKNRNKNYSGAYQYNQPFDLTLNYGVGGEFYISKDGVDIERAAFVANPYTVSQHIAFGALGTSYRFSGRCWRYSIKRGDGSYVLDYVPCRKDGVGMMYDRVSGQLFGSFGFGPDI